MRIESDLIKSLSIKDLLNNKESYVIPIYQRNYAWEAKEIEQLIQDIIDYRRYHPNRKYYIGTLVVSMGKNNGTIDFATIDGQQRLTTLSILSAVIKNKHKEIDMDWWQELNLHFASRRKSQASMKTVFEGKVCAEDYEANIKAAYEICEKSLEKKTKEHGITVKNFSDYLYQYVTILRVALPEKTDLNHYFEIMNSRGEQLEKHEILKAQLMECFNNYEPEHRDECMACFDLIWEACANMEKYVQYGFSAKTKQRDLIFGETNWNTLAVYSFDELVGRLKDTLKEDADTYELSIAQVLQEKMTQRSEEETEDSPDRFNSVVNFQNFLLHVLRVQTKKDEIALDDKRLLELFTKEIPKDGIQRIAFAKEFIYNLLKCKFLFDKYVIKREFTANTDRWSLKSLKCYRNSKKLSVSYVNTFGDENNDSFDCENRRVLMLLSMYHVSIPSMVYKYWLNAALNYLFHQIDITSTEYINYLEHIAKSFVFDKFLAKNPIGYYEIIYENISPIKRKIEQLDLNKLRFHQIENNLVFNFLDYLLWARYKDEESDSRVKAFEYTFRSSVEHYHPQNPINDDVDRIDYKHLHSFGNLCLISHEKNSRLSNFSAQSKREHYSKTTTIDSLKQYWMTNKYRVWKIGSIEEHNSEMIALLEKNMSSSFKLNADASLAAKWFSKYQRENPALLVRTLLCFGDCAKHEGGDRYSLFNFGYIRQHEAFQQFEAYVNSREPKSLQEIINTHLTYERLKKEYRYLFVKYPCVIDYCKNGKFDWYEETNGNLIYLLKENLQTKKQARELYTFILQQYLLEEHKIQQYTDYECLYILIGFVGGRYYLTENKSEASFELMIWNEKGNHIMHSLRSLVNGNSSAVKLLEEYKWYKNGEGDFERFGNGKLLKLDENFAVNITSLITEIQKLLKNGFAIKLI